MQVRDQRESWKNPNINNFGLVLSKISLNNLENYSLGRVLILTIFISESRAYLDLDKGHLPSTVVFHQRLYFIKGQIPSKAIFHQRSSSIKGQLLSKVIFRQRLSSIKGCLLSKVVFHQQLSSFKGHLPSPKAYVHRQYLSSHWTKLALILDFA